MGNLCSQFSIKYNNNKKKFKKCSTKKCINKVFLDNRCIYCYHVHKISLVNNEHIIINRKDCPYCVKSSLKGKIESIYYINADCCYDHSLYYEQIKDKIKISYDDTYDRKMKKSVTVYSLESSIENNDGNISVYSLKSS
jgi:hypothetical protein